MTDARAAHEIDFGYEIRTLRTARASMRVGVRLLGVSGVLVFVAVVAGFATLMLGDYPLRADQALAALVGGGEEFHRTIVLQWRVPIALAAIVFGAVLGVGGAIFQSLTRNPLGSPDVIGFDAGAYTAVVVTVLVLGTSGYWAVAAASLAGGLATAFLVSALAFRRGVQGFRLIVVGIAVSAALGSINAYVIDRADVLDAMAVGFWGAGSISDVTWTTMLPSLALAACILIAAALLSPALRRLELGDDAAATLGTRPTSARLALMVTGVATVALVTAAAGPIGFIALAAPQLARRLAGAPGVSLLASAAMGAALLALAQLLGLVIGALYRPIPVGLITVCVGGLYLIWLLIRESRRQLGGVA